MKSLQLIADFHRKQPIVKADFAYDTELITLIKSLANIKSPLDVIIESQQSEKQHIKTNKNE